MAAGDKWGLERAASVYVDDGGNNHSFRALVIYHNTASCGWTDLGNNGYSPCPKGLKPRVWLMHDPAVPSSRRRVVIATQAAYAAGVVNTTTLPCYDPVSNDEQTYTLYGKEGERHR